MEERDGDLVQSTINGDQAAFGRLMHKYQRQIYNFAYRMLGNQEDAGDLTQETFVRAYNALKTFRQDASFLTWLFKIANNLGIDQLRSRKAKGTLSLEVESEEGREPFADPRLSDPEECAIRGAEEEIVQNAILSLPLRYRKVVLMRHRQEMSVEEIAKALDLPVGTVKTHLFRAREMLRDRLSGLLEVEADGK